MPVPGVTHAVDTRQRRQAERVQADGGHAARAGCVPHLGIGAHHAERSASTGTDPAAVGALAELIVFSRGASGLVPSLRCRHAGLGGRRRRCSRLRGTRRWGPVHCAQRTRSPKWRDGCRNGSCPVNRRRCCRRFRSPPSRRHSDGGRKPGWEPAAEAVVPHPSIEISPGIVTACHVRMVISQTSTFTGKTRVVTSL